MEAIGVLGGTFDPIHHGHLRLALEMRTQLCLSAVRLIPAREPPHREKPRVSADARLRMLEAAIQNAPELLIDDQEIRRDGPSYTVDTLEALQLRFPGNSLCLILGTDAFAGLDRWHRWVEIMQVAHIAVARRPGTSLPDSGELADLVAARAADSPACLRQERAGRILVRNIPSLDISATRIRALVSRGESVRYLVPDAVHEMITNDRLYADSR